MNRFWVALLLAVCLGSGEAWGQWTVPVLFGVAHGNAIRRPWISNDGLRMYAAFSGYIFVSDRVNPDSAWSPFHTVGNNVNGALRQESPCESPTGDTLYFMAEGRDTCYGSYDIYYTIRTDSGWFGPIYNCGPNINSQWMEWTVGISRDGSKLIISSDRIPGGNLNLYISQRQEDTNWGPLLSCGPNVNDWLSYEEHGSLSPDNRRLFFYRSGPRHGDVYVSDWQDSSWGPATYLPEPVSTLEWEESDPCLAADGRTLYFISDRGERYNRQLYVTTDTSALTAEPRTRPLPQQVEPALFGQVQDQTLHLVLVGSSHGGRYPLRIYDLLGRVVMATTLELTMGYGAVRGQIPLRDLPSGAYLTDLQYGTHHFSTRFAITR